MRFIYFDSTALSRARYRKLIWGIIGEIQEIKATVIAGILGGFVLCLTSFIGGFMFGFVPEFFCGSRGQASSYYK